MNGSNYLKYISLTVTVLAVAACGGGGGGSGANTSGIPAPLPKASFSLAKIYSAVPSGLVYSSQLTGSSTDSATYTGSFSRTNQPKEMLNGVLVTPSEVKITLASNGLSQTFTTTTYIDSDDIHLSSRDSFGITCTPASPEKPPILVNIGDTGVFPITTCSDGTSYEASWKVTDAGDGTIFHIVTGTHKEGNTLKANYVETVNVNAAGFIVSYKTVTETIGGNTLTIQTL